MSSNPSYHHKHSASLSLSRSLILPDPPCTFSLSISPPLNATMAVFIRPRFETWIGGMEGPEVTEEFV